MLTSIMHNICKQTGRYGTDYWMFRISGKRVDICARSTNEKNPAQFRQAVIHIGQVLQEIDHRVRLNGYKTSIQSLPSLSEEHLIAIVRLQKNNDHFTPEVRKESITMIQPDQPIETFLKTIVSHYDLFLKPVQQTGRDHPDLHKIMTEYSIETDDKQCLALCSKTNNPFIWIKSGCCKEKILQLINHSPSFPDIEFFSLPEMKISPRLSCQFDECPYPQFLILV